MRTGTCEHDMGLRSAGIIEVRDDPDWHALGLKSELCLFEKGNDGRLESDDRSRKTTFMLQFDLL